MHRQFDNSNRLQIFNRQVTPKFCLHIFLCADIFSFKFLCADIFSFKFSRSSYIANNNRKFLVYNRIKKINFVNNQIIVVWQWTQIYKWAIT